MRENKWKNIQAKKDVYSRKNIGFKILKCNNYSINKQKII